MHPRKFIRDSVGLAFAQYVVRATLMLRGLIAARFLGPEAYGSWNAIQIMIDYGALAPTGTQQGLDQMVPPRIVGGDATALDRVKRAALFNIALMSGLYMAVCLAGLAFGHSRMLHQWGWLGVGAATLCALAVNLSYYQSSIMRSHGDISTESGRMMLQGAIGGVLGLALMPWLGAWGLLAGWLAGNVTAMLFAAVRSREHAPRLPRPAGESFELVSIGFPMFVFTASSLAMRNLDRLIILRYVSTEALGYYSLSVMALAFLMYMPDSITYVLYPQLLRQYGASGGDPESIRPRIERVLQLFSVVLPALCGLAFLASRPLVLMLLPKFMPGVGAMRVLCFGAVALAFTNLASVVLMTVGRQMLLMPAALFGVGIYAALDLVAVKTGHGITGVAWATLAAYGVTGALMLGLAFHSLRYSTAAALAQLGRVFGPMVLGLATCVVLERFTPWADRTGASWLAFRMLVKLAVFGGVYLLCVLPLSRGMGLMRIVSEFNLPVIGPLVRRLRGGNGDGA